MAGLRQRIAGFSANSRDFLRPVLFCVLIGWDF
jgi:hypothetical protein